MRLIIGRTRGEPKDRTLLLTLRQRDFSAFLAFFFEKNSNRNVSCVDLILDFVSYKLLST